MPLFYAKLMKKGKSSDIEIIMKKKIYKYLDDPKKYAPTMAKEIVEAFVNEANDDNIDYSFTISRKTGKVYTKEPNTYFMFDTKVGTVLDEFKKALFDKDLEDIEEKSEEEEKLMEDVRNFLLKVCKTVTNFYSDKLKETVRRVILGGKVSDDVVPLDTIEVLSIDLADYTSVPESSKYLLKIGKSPGSDINTDEVVKFIQARQEKTGMDIDTIFSIEKKAGNPLFKNIEAIILGKKFLNEISIYFFVDYSIVEQEEEEKEEKVLDTPKE